jgi:hypothetical protein
LTFNKNRRFGDDGFFRDDVLIAGAPGLIRELRM